MLCVDIVEQKLEVAMAMGAEHVIKVNTRDARKLANQIKDTMGVAPDVAIECTGIESSVATAIYVSVYNYVYQFYVLLLGNSFRRSNGISRTGCSHGNHSSNRCIS